MALSAVEKESGPVKCLGPGIMKTPISMGRECRGPQRVCSFFKSTLSSFGGGGTGERGRERREKGREEGEEAGKDREKRKGKRNPKTPILKAFCETQMSQNVVLLNCAGMQR